MEATDRRRAAELAANEATRRMLAPDEIMLLREAVITSSQEENERGVALSILRERSEAGIVLTSSEADALARAIDEIWLSKPAQHIASGRVRDETATCRRCTCEGSTCPECKSCAFDVEHTGGSVRNSLSRAPLFTRPLPSPEDCGCSSPRA